MGWIFQGRRPDERLQRRHIPNFFSIFFEHFCSSSNPWPPSVFSDIRIRWPRTHAIRVAIYHTSKIAWRLFGCAF